METELLLDPAVTDAASLVTDARECGPFGRPSREASSRAFVSGNVNAAKFLGNVNDQDS